MRRIPAYVYLIILISAVILYVYCIYCHTVYTVEMREGGRQAGRRRFRAVAKGEKVNEFRYIFTCHIYITCHLYKHEYTCLTFVIIKRINNYLLLYLLFTLLTTTHPPLTSVHKLYSYILFLYIYSMFIYTPLHTLAQPTSLAYSIT